MPICKYCHKTISNFDKDVCPYCGEKDPIEETYETKDMTQFVNPVTGEYKLYKTKSRKVAVVLCFFFGFLGASSFYLGYWKRGISILTGSLIFILGVGLLLHLGLQVPLSPYLCYLIPVLGLLLASIGFSIRYMLKDSVKDKNGEFLR